MTITVSAPTYNRANTSGATLVLPMPTLPGGLQAGDVLAAGLRTNASNAPTDFAASGFTRRGYTFVPNDPAGRVLSLQTHVVTDPGSEPASVTFTKSVADPRRAGIMYAIRGLDVADLILGQSTGWDATPSPTIRLNSYAHSTTVEGIALYMFGTEITAGNATAPTVTPGTQIGLVASEDISGGDVTGVTRTVLWAGYEIITAASLPTRSVTWSLATGAAATGVTLRALSTPTPPPDGFPSVPHLLATPGATWAHRGGSANWPEMSQYAYDQAVLAGYGALEFSANRTSDGVWIGCHDASLNRTSQTTGLPDISAMTWAQVQTYQNTLNSAGTPRPYFRLDAFLDTYTDTHVAIVDPKYAIGAHNAEFLALLDAHGGPGKIIVKFYGYGSGATALADAARVKGYTTWGYYYEEDVANGNLAGSQSHWHLLGMNYDASQAAWDAVLSYGKAVVGHIAGSQANYNTARAKGARMVQCANVAGIAAVGPSATRVLSLVERVGGVSTPLTLVERVGGVTQALTLLEIGSGA